MSNPTSDNKENKSRAKGPSLRIATAGDIPEERLVRVAAKFAEVNEIEDYRLIIESKEGEGTLVKIPVPRHFVDDTGV